MSMYNLGKTCGPSPHRGFLDRIASVERQLHERLPESCNLRGHLKQKIRMSQDEWIGTVQTSHTHLLLTFELWGQKLKMLMEENNSNLEMKLFALERQLKEGAKGDQWRLVLRCHPSLFLILEFPCFLKVTGQTTWQKVFSLLDLSLCRSDTCTRHHALWAPHRWHPKAQTGIAVVQGNVVIRRFCFGYIIHIDRIPKAK